MDYIPFYPWFGLVLLGVYLESINLHRIPLKRIFPVGFFEIMGKHSLKIYLLHRPIVFRLVYALYELNIFQNLHYVYRHQGGNLGDGRTNLHTNSLTGLHGLTAGAEVNF